MDTNINEHKNTNTGKEVVCAGLGGVAGTLFGQIISQYTGLGNMAALAAGISAASKCAFTKLFNNIFSKEEKRVENTASIIAAQISERLKNGASLRKDLFPHVKADVKVEADAELLLEGFLRSVKDEYEEKKLQYQTNLFVELMFDASVAVPLVNYYIKLVKSLTYQQLLIISAIGHFMNNKDKIKLKNYKLDVIDGFGNIAIGVDIFNLYQLSIVSPGEVIFQGCGFNPSNLRLVGHGPLLYSLMDLKKMEEEADFKTIENFFLA